MPNQHGGCVYPHALLTELQAAGTSIDYGWIARPLHRQRWVMRDPLAMPYVSRGFVTGTRKVGQFLVPHSPSDFFASNPNGSLEACPGLRDQRFVADLIRRLNPTAVLVDGTPTLPILDLLSAEERSRIRVGVLTHNLNSRRTELYRSCGQPLDFLPMTENEEAELLRRADLIVAIQEREAAAFARMCPGQSVVTVPLPLRPEPLPITGSVEGRCVFVGGFSGHNIEALRWLFADVWPNVRRQLPHAELVVAGTVAKAFSSVPDGVRLLGPVAELRSVYQQASLSLVPLPMGTGLKIKLVEAMSLGRAVITTPSGAEGFADVENGHVAAVADTAAEFAAATVRLLQDAREREAIAQRQLAWVGRRLAPSAVLQPLAALWRAPARVPDAMPLPSLEKKCAV